MDMGYNYSPSLCHRKKTYGIILGRRIEVETKKKINERRKVLFEHTSD